MVTAGLVSGAMQYFKKMKRMGKQMRPVKILTDSCSDLSKDLREKYNIDYARMKTVHNNAEQWASLDFEYYTPYFWLCRVSEVYRALKKLRS